MAKPAKVHPWEHALTCPLPARDASYHDLTELRDIFLIISVPSSTTFTLDGGDDRDKEIQRAADRLKKISRMIAAVPPEILGQPLSQSRCDDRANPMPAVFLAPGTSCHNCERFNRAMCRPRSRESGGEAALARAEHSPP